MLAPDDKPAAMSDTCKSAPVRHWAVRNDSLHINRVNRFVSEIRKVGEKRDEKLNQLKDFEVREKKLSKQKVVRRPQ